MAMFAAVSRFPKGSIKLPERKTKCSAGYDFEVAEDIIIPSYKEQMGKLGMNWDTTRELDDMATITKAAGAKPTLVPTGIKCYMSDNQYLELSVRSSCPLKYWLILANGVGIIDADYCDNEDNEGEIFFQIINLSPFPILLKKGDIIGQGILKKYEIMADDAASGDRLGGFGSTSKQQGQPQEIKVKLDFTTNGSTRGVRAAINPVSDFSDKDKETVKKAIQDYYDLSGSYAIGNQASAASQYSQAEGFNSLAQAVGASGITFNEALEAVKAAAQQCKQGIIDEISDSITYALGGKSNDEITRFRSKF